jgi:hypothetical protein
MGKDKDDNSWYQFKDQMRDISKPLNMDQEDLATKLNKLSIPQKEILFAVRGYQEEFPAGNRHLFWKDKGPYNDYVKPFEELANHFIPSLMKSDISIEDLVFKAAFAREIFLFILSGCKSLRIQSNKSQAGTIDLEKGIQSSITQHLNFNPIFCKAIKPKIKNKDKNDPFMKKQRKELREMKKDLKEKRKLKASQDQMMRDQKQIDNFNQQIDNIQENFNLGYSLDEELYLPGKLGKAITKLYHEANISPYHKVKLQELIENTSKLTNEIEEQKKLIEPFLSNIMKAMEQTKEQFDENPYAKIKAADKTINNHTSLVKQMWSRLKPTLEFLLSKRGPLEEKVPEVELQKRLQQVLEIRDFYLNSNTTLGKGMSDKINGFLKQRHLI